MLIRFNVLINLLVLNVLLITFLQQNMIQEDQEWGTVIPTDFFCLLCWWRSHMVLRP